MKLLLAGFILAGFAFGQLSGVGQIGCNATPVSGSVWNSGTSLNTTQVVASNVAASQVIVVLDQTTTITGGGITFQGDYGDGNFVNVPAAQILSPATLTPLANPYTLVASTNQAFLVAMSGFYRLQLKLTTALTGSGSVTPYTTLLCYQLYPAATSGGIFNSSPPSLTNGQSASNQFDSAGNLLSKVNAALPTGANVIGGVTQSSGPWTQNITQFGGNSVATGTGAGGSGIPRFTISNDSSLAANQSVNISQIAGTALVVDACQANAHTSVNINLTTNTRLITGSASKQTYICSIDIVAGSATNVALVEGTGSSCGTSTAGMAGGTTAASGWSFAANGGLVKGTGANWVYRTATLANDVCILVSSANQISGSIQYVQQ